MSEESCAYDTVSYPSHPLPQAHPARLAAIARLHGVAAASPAKCRMLEVGCGDATSLISVAMAYPHSEFLGVDLSREAIGRGEAVRQKLGLSNLRLVAADLTQWEAGPEAFDYIVAHGFYSWVPPFVRDALMDLCRRTLAADGVAYISYNALPGCRIRQIFFDMLRFHTRAMESAQEKIDQAQEFIKFIAQAMPGTGPISDAVRDEARRIPTERHPSVLYHDDLADINTPMLVTDFVKHGLQFGLQFLGEADYHEMTPDLLPANATEVLKSLTEADVVLKEQYLDFLKMRRFRQTLLCRADRPYSAKADPAVVRRFAVAGDPVPEPQPADLAPDVRVRFRAKNRASMSVSNPLAKAALVAIGEGFPARIAVSELVSEARHRLGRNGDSDVTQDAEVIANVLYNGFRIGLVDLLVDPPNFATEPSATPRLSRLARLQLEAGQELLTGLLPSVVRMDNPITRQLLSLLDGHRDRAAIAESIAAWAAANSDVANPGEPTKPLEWWRKTLGSQLENGLMSAAKLGLLEA